MHTAELAPIFANLFKELTRGVKEFAFIVNAGDAGLIGSLEKLSAEQASQASQGGATIAAHADHVRYGLSLMNRWSTEGGNPFAHARWNDAWEIRSVDEIRWKEIQLGLRNEVHNWQEALRKPREVNEIEISGMIGSIVHTAYHLGAIRQINASTRGPKEGSDDQ